MLTIRLQRAGKKNRPEYRVVLAEKTAASQKKFVEVLGHYNPHTKALNVRNADRVQYWIGQHVELSPTIHNLFVSHKLVTGDKKVKAFSLPKKEVKAEEPPAPAETAAETAEETPAAEAPSEEQPAA